MPDLSREALEITLTLTGAGLAILIGAWVRKRSQKSDK